MNRDDLIKFYNENESVVLFYIKKRFGCIDNALNELDCSFTLDDIKIRLVSYFLRDKKNGK